MQSFGKEAHHDPAAKKKRGGNCGPGWRQPEQHPCTGQLIESFDYLDITPSNITLI